MKLCIAGKNDIAVNALSFLINNKIVPKEDLLACFTKNDNGVDSFQRSYKKFTIENKIDAVPLDALYGLDDLIFISLEFDRIIPVEKFSSSLLFNIHFSLLPKYKGMYTSAWPILNGETTSGVTLHLIDEGIDTGDIIDQLEFVIENNDVCRDLYLKYIKFSFELFAKNITSILAGTYTSKQQSSLSSSYYAKSSIDYKALRIDLNKTAYEIRNQLRAFNFPEYQIPNILGYDITSCEILHHRTRGKPGKLLVDNNHYMDISTIDYDLRLYKKDQKNINVL